MSSKIRGAMVSAFALVAFLGFASGAAALTVSPSGAYTAASGTTTLGLDSNGQSLTCSASSIGATINSDGTGSVPSGSATYTSCSNALLGSFTVTQTSAWTLRTVLSGSTISLVVSVPSGGVTLRGTSCTFTLGGDVTLQTTVSGLPATVQNGLRTVSSTLAITSTNCVALFPVGLRASRYGATYDLSRAATISG